MASNGDRPPGAPHTFRAPAGAGLPARPLRDLLLALRRHVDGVEIAEALGVSPPTVYNWSAGRLSSSYLARDPVPARYRTPLTELARRRGVLTPAGLLACAVGPCLWTGASWDALQLHDALEHVPPASEEAVLQNPYRTRAVVRAVLELLDDRFRRRGYRYPSRDVLGPVRRALAAR